MDAALIGAVLAANALIGGAQHVGADRAMSRLVDSSAVRVMLRRDGIPAQARALDLVPGDVVDLQAGDAVPADCRLLDAVGLEVDESSLTGESLLVTKNSGPSLASAVADASTPRPRADRTGTGVFRLGFWNACAIQVHRPTARAGRDPPPLTVCMLRAEVVSGRRCRHDRVTRERMRRTP
jgi:cation-transporting ATPase I